MKNALSNTIKVSLLSLMISGTAIADGALTPVGALQAGNNVIIQNELGQFPVAGNYTVLAGDQINTADGKVATLTVEGGNLYISPGSQAKVSGSNGQYTVELISGSMGYKLNGHSQLKIISSGQEITPSAIDGEMSGAIALGENGRLVVSPLLGNALAVASDGMVTTIEQGHTWTNTGKSASMTLTQVSGSGMGLGLKILIGVVAVGAGIAIVKKIDDDDDESNDDEEDTPSKSSS